MEHGTACSHRRGSMIDVSYISGDSEMCEPRLLPLLLKACGRSTESIYENCWAPLVFGQIMHSVWKTSFLEVLLSDLSFLLCKQQSLLMQCSGQRCGPDPQGTFHKPSLMKN